MPTKPKKLDSRIDTCDWREAFTYACNPDEAPPGSDVDRSDFTRDDVSRILYIEEGENDGNNWIGVFKLRDRRYAFLSAGCDYTGWD